MLVNVLPLKTSGSLRLSVIGVKVNSKEVLGVLDIPLADAICCCTERFDDEDHSTNSYVRWFPLSDPKWTDSGDIDICDSHKTVVTEKKDSNCFDMNYTKCIKLAMWWTKDEENTFKFSNNPIDASSNFTETYFNANVNGISAAIIDSFRARELLSLSFTGIDVRVLVTKPKTWLGFAMGSIQFDHNNENALEPVILSPTPQRHPQPTIQFRAERDNIKSKGNIDSFEQVAFQLEELDLRIEERWIFDLWEMYTRLQKRYHVMQKSVTRRTSHMNMSHTTEKPHLYEGFAADVTSANQSKEIIDAINETIRDKDDLEAEANTFKKIYINMLMLGSVRLNISYIKSIRDKLETSVANKHENMKKKSVMSSHRRAEIFRRWSEFGHDEDWRITATGKSRNLPIFISAVFPAISDAPVRVNGKVLNNVFVTWSELVATLKNYYAKEITFQFYKIIGSLDIVGNPTMVVNSLLKGARDFVVIPVQEFIRSPNNPSRLGIGFLKGSLSFISHFFSGVFGFLSNVSTIHLE